MKTIIVGGGFGNLPKISGIISKLAKEFETPVVINGGTFEDLPFNLTEDLILWMPDISNEDEKHYPNKGAGSVLVCSKFMRTGYKRIDAVSRIFKMHGNAVIAIYKEKEICSFELIDALNNVWYSGDSIEFLADAIKSLYSFTKMSIRYGSEKSEDYQNNIRVSFSELASMTRLLNLNQALSERIMTQCGNRFFGNLSTRCQSLFPSLKGKIGTYVSPRNTDKNGLSVKDMVLCSLENFTVIYHNGKKPSVDSPIQLLVYETVPEINFMIHGHAKLVDKKYSFFVGKTNNYRLCGDVRETDEILEAIQTETSGIICLKNHGFLIFGEDLETMEKICNEACFVI